MGGGRRRARREGRAARGVPESLAGADRGCESQDQGGRGAAGSEGDGRREFRVQLSAVTWTQLTGPLDLQRERQVKLSALSQAA